MEILLIFFFVGLVFLMLFSEDGRGCLGGIFAIIFSIGGIIILGAFLIFFIFFVIFVLFQTFFHYLKVGP